MTRPTPPPQDDTYKLRLKIMADIKVLFRKRTQGPDIPTPPAGDKLWQRVTYAGAVALPNFTNGTNKFAFINGAPFTYDTLHDNYLMGCFDQSGMNVIRVSLPEPVPHPGDGTLTDVPEATVLMDDWVEISDGQHTVAPALSQGVLCGGCLVDGTDIWGLQEPRYNGSATQFPFIFRVDNTADLTSLSGDPPWSADIHWHNLCRCITRIRQGWADTHVGGRSFLSGVGTGIAQFMNRGPVAIAFDKPTSPGQVLTTQSLIYYDNEDPYIWGATGLEWDDSFEQMSQHWVVDGSNDWLIQTGIVTLGNYAYKADVGCGLIDGPVGYPYFPYLMVWHADQLADAAARTIQPNEQTPREIIDLSQYFVRRDDSCLFRFSHGSAWNQSINRLWVMEPRGRDEPFDDLPVLHAFDIGA